MHGELTTLSSCICPGHEAVFECVVTGGGATIWSGTAFDRCSSDASAITLRHSQFMNQSGYSLSQNCSDSASIIGRAVSVVNDSYTSQLIVNVSQSLIGANVVCATDSEPHIGTRQILVTTGTCIIYYDNNMMYSDWHFYAMVNIFTAVSVDD